MSEKVNWSPHGTFNGGETYERGCYFRTELFRGHPFGISGRRGSLVSSTVQLADAGSVEEAKERVREELACKIAGLDREWRKYIIPEGKYRGLTMEFIYASDYKYLVEVLCGGGVDKDTQDAANAAIEYKNNIDPWSRY
jgi:hypothetical protein